jgi:hypothetical protein
MALPTERVMQLRRLAQQLEASPPSPGRDELLHRTRLRMIEVEEPDFDPPSSLPALGNESIRPLTPRRYRRPPERF